MLGGICELTLETGHVGALERFDTQAFGVRVLPREPDRVWLAVGPSSRLRVWTPGRKVSLGADALDRLRARLTRIGADPVGPVPLSGGGRSLYVQDPEGNVVEVWDYFVDGQGSRCGLAAPADEPGDPAGDPAHSTYSRTT